MLNLESGCLLMQHYLYKLFLDAKSLHLYMLENEKYIRAGKFEKINNKKNKSGSTDALLPIIRNVVDTISETTEASRAADISTLLNDQKSPQEKTDQSSQPLTSHSQSQSLLMSPEDNKTMKAELPEMTETEKLDDVAIEQQLASLNQRLKTLIDENEWSKKRDEQLFTIKNEILAKIDHVKKQIDEAMDHYRDIAHACHEKIEKEEILQNEMFMDLKERVDKLNDICTDINNQVDDMTVTLNAYNIGKSDLLYIITAYSVDVIVRFFQRIYATIISVTKV
ncbi:Triosephosphate isomerase [Dirofilaria immitis]